MEYAMTFFSVIDLLGVFSFSLSGAITAMCRKMDSFGVIILGMTTAMGGGIIRDILIGRIPPGNFYSYPYVGLSVLAALSALLFGYVAKRKNKFNLNTFNLVNNIFDAVGLGIFSVSGVRIAIEAGFGDNVLFCIFLGAMTGCGGGVLRDVMSKTVPYIFVKHIYAIASLIGSMSYYVMAHFYNNIKFAMIIGVAITFVIRMLATVFRWSLPKVYLPDGSEKVKPEMIKPPKDKKRRNKKRKKAD